MHKTILLAALLGLLPVPSQATCAWGLWIRHFEGDLGVLYFKTPYWPWRLENVYATREQCTARIQASIDQYTAAFPNGKHSIGGNLTLEQAKRDAQTGQILIDTHDEKGTIIETRYFCVPDTMNPNP